MGMILVTASVAVFVWAVVGLIRPTWARLPSRAASVGVWVLSVVLFIIGGALMPDSMPEPTEKQSAVAAPATDERVHPESDFQAQVQRLIQQRPARWCHDQSPRVPQRSHPHGQPGGISASGVNDMRPAARSRSERLVEMVGDGRRPRCRRHDPVVHRPHTRRVPKKGSPGRSFTAIEIKYQSTPGLCGSVLARATLKNYGRRDSEVLDHAAHRHGIGTRRFKRDRRHAHKRL